jgi:hypothetical protein
MSIEIFVEVYAGTERSNIFCHKLTVKWINYSSYPMISKGSRQLEPGCVMKL